MGARGRLAIERYLDEANDCLSKYQFKGSPYTKGLLDQCQYDIHVHIFEQTCVCVSVCVWLQIFHVSPISPLYKDNGRNYARMNMSTFCILITSHLIKSVLFCLEMVIG